MKSEPSDSINVSSSQQFGIDNLLVFATVREIGNLLPLSCRVENCKRHFGWLIIHEADLQEIRQGRAAMIGHADGGQVGFFVVLYREDRHNIRMRQLAERLGLVSSFLRDFDRHQPASQGDFSREIDARNRTHTQLVKNLVAEKLGE